MTSNNFVDVADNPKVGKGQPKNDNEMEDLFATYEKKKKLENLHVSVHVFPSFKSFFEASKQPIVITITNPQTGMLHWLFCAKCFLAAVSSWVSFCEQNPGKFPEPSGFVKCCEKLNLTDENDNLMEIKSKNNYSNYNEAILSYQKASANFASNSNQELLKASICDLFIKVFKVSVL